LNSIPTGTKKEVLWRVPKAQRGKLFPTLKEKERSTQQKGGWGTSLLKKDRCAGGGRNGRTFCEGKGIAGRGEGGSFLHLRGKSASTFGGQLRSVREEGIYHSSRGKGVARRVHVLTLPAGELPSPKTQQLGEAR